MAEQTTNRARPEEADIDAAQLTPDEVTTLVNFAELIRTAEAKAAKHQAPARPGFGLVVAVCVAVCVGIINGTGHDRRDDRRVGGLGRDTDLYGRS